MPLLTMPQACPHRCCTERDPDSHAACPRRARHPEQHVNGTNRLEQAYLDGSLPYIKARTTKTACAREGSTGSAITMTDEELDGRLSEAFIHFPLSAENKTSVEASKRPNMFLLFAVTGTSVQYRLLAQRMPTYQVIGVDNLRTNQPEAYLSITSIAADLAAILRRQQPRGLYTLGGFSFGGLVAWGRRAISRGATWRDLSLIHI